MEPLDDGASLRALEAFARRFLENAPHLGGILELDGSVRYANRVARDFLRVDFSKVLGLPAWETPWWSHDAAQQEVLKDAVMRAAAGPVEFLATHLARDGSLRTVAVSLRPLEDEAGVVRALVSEGRDVTEERATTEQLRTALESFQVMARNAPVILYAFDRNAVFTLSEGKQLSTMGLKPGQIVGQSAYDVYRDRPGDFSNFQRSLTGESFKVAVRFGRNVLDAYHEPIYGPDGQYAGTVGVLVDVTDRAEVEAALERANRRLRMLSDCNAAMIGATDESELLSTICTIVVEQGGYRMAWVGFAEGDAAQSVRPVAQAGHEDGYLASLVPTWGEEGSDRCACGTAIRVGKPSPVQRILTEQGQAAAWHVEAARRGYQSMCGFPIVCGGRTIGALGVYSAEPEAFDADEVALLTELVDDLAFGLSALRTARERSRAESALHAKEEWFRRVVDLSTGLIAVCDDRGTITAVSGALFETVGYEGVELVGRSALAVVHADDVATVREAFREVLSAPGARASREFRFFRRDGTTVWCEATGTNLLEDELVHGVVVNVRDITERKVAEQERIALQNQLQQAMKMEAVGRLAGGVAHDFNNLLTAIIGNVELARLDLPDADPVARTLEAIAQAADSAATLTSRLLAFSRRQVVEARTLNLNDLVTSLQKMLARVIGEDIELRCHLEGDLGSVRVDQGQFEQVLVNLVVNARDAMPRGGTVVIETANVELDDAYCSRHAAALPGPHVLLAVTDTGEGMTDEVKRHLFEPFFTTKPVGRGTGLGLATTFGAVSQARGSIQVYSELGRGTTVSIYLPRVFDSVEGLETRVDAQGLATGSETVLMAEDDPYVREVTRSFLLRLGYRVLCAASGPEALEIAQASAEPIHLLFTDVVMPGMNGPQLADRLLALRPSTKVVFTSGYTHEVVLHHGVGDRPNFLRKPFTLRLLSEMMRTVLDRADDAPGA